MMKCHFWTAAEFSYFEFIMYVVCGEPVSSGYVVYTQMQDEYLTLSTFSHHSDSTVL